jgi:hypothetical protein
VLPDHVSICNEWPLKARAVSGSTIVNASCFTWPAPAPCSRHEPGKIGQDPRRRGISGQPHPRGPGVDRPLPRRWDADSHIGIVNLSSGSEYAPRTRALGLGATLTTLYLQFEKEAEAALGLPPNVHSYALLPIGYPMGRFRPVRRVPLADVVYEDRWGQPCRDP